MCKQKEEADLIQEDAMKTAHKSVAAMLQRPDQLEKLDQYLKRTERKQASIEGMLKSVVQSLVDGYKNGQNLLKLCSEEIKEVKKDLKEVDEKLTKVSVFVDKLRPVRDEAVKHSQYAAAVENLKHIFDVPESVQRSRQYISEGKLLEAHLTLMDLENSRDDLLFEMHRLSSTSSSDKSMLKHYFSEVEKISEELGKQLWLIFRLTLNSIRREPAIIVTALRIVEREEKRDEVALRRQESTQFIAPGRPKKWKNRIFEILEEAACERIAGNQLEDRSQDKMWLVRHLEITRQLILEDLRVLKVACVACPCFPKKYNIVQEMVRLYHRCLSDHLENLAQSLEGNEYITLLNWVQVYEGPELMGHPSLGIDLNKEGLGPLLPKPQIDEITKKYLETIRKNYKEWLNNTINRETRDWEGSTEPEADDAGHYQTTTPVIVFQMIDQHLQVAKTVDQRLVNRVLIISMEHLDNFAKQYREAVGKLSHSHFEDRCKFKYFTPYMIAIANNCDSFIEIAKKFSKQYESKPDNFTTLADEVFGSVYTSFESLRVDTIQYLLQEVFMDVNHELSKVGSKDWLDGKHCVVENVCLTLDDYFRDYSHLKIANFEHMRSSLQTKLAKEYLTALLQKKTVLKDQSNREQFAKRFVREAETLKSHLARYPSSSTMARESPFDVVNALSEFLTIKDVDSMLFLEISGLIQKYPDINASHLVALLSLREDMAKTNVSKTVNEMMPELSDFRKSHKKTIFSEIKI